ncbi:fibrobacter succinogenes major paralogous domain-containing protein, partial [Flavobacterium proteolyticum]
NDAGSVGKGLVFPQTDLTTWTFDTSALDGINFPTAFDGMIVYNTGSGSTLENQGQIVSVTPGFYYFSNPGATDNITNGRWIKFEAGAAGGKFVDGTDPADAVYTAGKVGIGTTTPSGKLTIKGDNIYQVIENTNGDSKLILYNKSLTSTSIPDVYVPETSSLEAKAYTPQIGVVGKTSDGNGILRIDAGTSLSTPLTLQEGRVFINNDSGNNAITLINDKGGREVRIGGYGSTKEGFRREIKSSSIYSDRITMGGRVEIPEVRDFNNSFYQTPLALSFPGVTTAGFLPPKLTTAQMQALTPVAGLMVYNTTINCLMYFDGTEWRCDKNGTTILSSVNINSLGAALLPEVNECLTKTISVSGCASVPNATINDDPVTTLGIEYNWADGMASMGFTDRALVEIGGQCWFRYNANIIPSNYPDLPNTGRNIWNSEFNPIPGTYRADKTSWGYYNAVQPDGSLGWATSPATPGEGILYQFKAAMNGATQERAQGVCPTGFHVPSDCEFIFLEKSLGMANNELYLFDSRDRGVTSNVGTKLRGFGNNYDGTLNLTGFNLMLGGQRNNGPSPLTFNGRGIYATLTTSSSVSENVGIGRAAYVNTKDFSRLYSGRFPNSLRCLKD